VRLLLVNQFYPPDMAPTGQVLHDLAKVLVARGHEVRVVCSRRSYDGGGDYEERETIDGVEVRRLSTFGFGRRGAGRAMDYLSFHSALIAGVWEARPFDVALSLTTPPYVGWTLGHSLGLRARQHVNWVMDLYPDVVAAHGALRPGSVTYRALSFVARRQMARTALVIAIGPRMAARVRTSAPVRTRVEWVPLWSAAEAGCVEPAAVSAVRSSRGWGIGSTTSWLPRKGWGPAGRYGLLREGASGVARSTASCRSMSPRACSCCHMYRRPPSARASLRPTCIWSAFETNGKG
jgi:hypothetical protein